MAGNLYITGFIVPTHIMRRYLEGLGNVFDDPTSPTPSTRSSTSGGDSDESDDVEEEDEELGRSEDEEDDDHHHHGETEEVARAMNEIELFHRYVCCFRRVRRAAPPELRTRLDMPSSA